MGIWTQIANLTGPTGPQGPVNPSSAPTDTAVGGWISTTGGSVTQTSGDNRWGTTLYSSSYGAVGDGTTDDTTALQALITAAKAIKGTARLVPNKTYIINTFLDITGIRLELAGSTLKVKNGTTMAGPAVFATSTCTLIGGTIDLNKANTTDPATDTAGMAFYAYNVTGWVDPVNVTDVKVINGYQVGIRVGSNAAITDPLNAQLCPTNITNPEIIGGKWGIWVLAAANVSIINPRISTTSADGIYDFLSLNTKVRGGYIKSAGDDGVLTQQSYGCSIKGVTVESSTVGGIVVGGGSTSLVEAKNFIISGNNVRGCTSNGISVDTTKTGATTTPVASYSVVADNISDGNGVNGIYINNGKYVTVTGNTCRGNATAGILIPGVSCTINGNVLVANAYGLYLAGSVTGYGTHDVGRNTVIGNTTANYAFDSHGADNTTLHLSGPGVPAIAAPQGSTFHRTDGGASTSLYVKESGGITSTGWVAK